jgi:hypothetical protein
MNCPICDAITGIHTTENKGDTYPPLAAVYRLPASIPYYCALVGW